jgi:hypothetical protein
MANRTAFPFLRLYPKGLFIFASITWIFAGIMLINKGFQYLPEETTLTYIKIPLAFVAGLFFYYFVFTKIMVKYTEHILMLQPQQKHPFYKAFRLRFYIMITVMISSGVLFRKVGIVPIEYLALFYFTMGTPLLISSVEFLQMAKKTETK